MRKLAMIIAFVLPLAASAQKSPVDKLFEKYANQEGFTTVNITGKLLNFVGKLDENHKDTTLEMLSKLTGIRILSVENKDLNQELDFYKELEKDGFFKNNTYEVLMEVTEKDEVVRILAKDGGENKFSELLLVVGGKDNALISIRGVINPENIGKITSSLNLDIPKADFKKK